MLSLSLSLSLSLITVIFWRNPPPSIPPPE